MTFVPGNHNPQKRACRLRLGAMIAASAFMLSGCFAGYVPIAFIPDGGLVASGGTDLFLAGTTRRIEGNACVGGHAWADTDHGSARNAPEEVPVHRTYLRYYEDIDITPAFYWFTLEVANIEETHWMSPAKRARFEMATVPSSTPQDHDPAHCDARGQH